MIKIFTRLDFTIKLKLLKRYSTNYYKLQYSEVSTQTTQYNNNQLKTKTPYYKYVQLKF